MALTAPERRLLATLSEVLRDTGSHLDVCLEGILSWAEPDAEIGRQQESFR